jgi:hypothetical protein
MRIISLILAVLAAAAGLWAAVKWYVASQTKVPRQIPSYVRDEMEVTRSVLCLGGRSNMSNRHQLHIQGRHSQSHEEMLMAALESSHEAGFLNRRAALWTAISLGLGALSAAIGSFDK